MADPRKYVDGSSSLVLGCDSYSQSAELNDKEFVMGQNVVVRGGIVQTRPGSRQLICPPTGNFQGCTLFTPANGIAQLVFAVDGKVYVSLFPFTSYQRLWPLQFSNTAKYIAWAVCLKSTDYDALGNLIAVDNPYSVLVMQDGYTRAAYWDGSTAAHLNPATPDYPDQTDVIPGYTETPIGLWMIWSGNRLWVSRGNQIFASDIGNPLKFTESLYLNEARAFYLSGDCTGMIEVPTDGSTSKGFIAFTQNDGTLFQSYIQDRTQWLNTPLFQNTIIPTVGCVAPRSLVTQYGLNWWFGARGLTNINSALRQNITSRLDLQDNEMFTSKAYLSPDLSGICGSYFENYLFMSVPSQDVYNRHTWVLDQAPFEGNANSWCGFWSGWRPIEWCRGIVNGAERVFFGSVDYDGRNRIWEAMLPERTDNGCRITCYAQLRDHTGQPPNLDRKSYEWSKFFLSQIYGDVDLNVYVASTKGGYQLQKNYHIVASQGQVFSDVQYSENGPLMIGNIVQSRVIRTPEAQGDNECNACGVESQEGNMIDYAFSHLLVWSGQMGLRAYQMHMRQEPDRDSGDCEEPEVGPRSLNAAGCSGLELLVDSQVFEVFTARRDGVATLANGGDVFIQGLGFSVISQDVANAAAEEAVVATVNQVAGTTIAPGVYGGVVPGSGGVPSGGSGAVPFPDGGAGINPDNDGGGVLGAPTGPGAPGGPQGGDQPANGPDIGNGGGIVVDEPLEPTVQTPTIIQDPVASTIDEGADTSFSVAAEGTMPLVYQWQESTDGGGTWPNITNGGVYSGATTQHLVITAATAGMTTYQYRCRVTNAYGAVASAAAVLTVNAAGCTWTPPANDPLDSQSQAALDAYSAAYGDANFISLSSSLTPPNFSAAVIGSNTFAPPGNATETAVVMFAVTFASAGAKSFQFDVTEVAGAFTGAMGISELYLYESDGTTLVDSDSDPSTGVLSTVFSLNAPSAGQYVLLGKAVRVAPSPGSQFQLEVGYTLGAGDHICTI